MGAQLVVRPLLLGPQQTDSELAHEDREIPARFVRRADWLGERASFRPLGIGLQVPDPLCGRGISRHVLDETVE